MYINWTPTRELVGGSGSDGKLELGVKTWNEDRKPVGKQHTSLSGARETVLHRIDNIVSVQVVPTRGVTTRDKMREFMASVAAGETFTIDHLGSEASPVDALTVRMAQGSYKETYHGDYIFSYTFKIII